MAKRHTPLIDKSTLREDDTTRQSKPGCATDRTLTPQTSSESTSDDSGSSTGIVDIPKPDRGF